MHRPLLHRARFWRLAVSLLLVLAALTLLSLPAFAQENTPALRPRRALPAAHCGHGERRAPERARPAQHERRHRGPPGPERRRHHYGARAPTATGTRCRPPTVTRRLGLCRLYRHGRDSLSLGSLTAAPAAAKTASRCRDTGGCQDAGAAETPALPDASSCDARWRAAASCQTADSSSSGAPWQQVVSTRINVRSGPGTNYGVVSSANSGAASPDRGPEPGWQLVPGDR